MSNKKIICQLQGGLGNQLFQYAIAKYIQIKTSRQLIFNYNYLSKSILKNNNNDVFYIKNEKTNSYANKINLLDLVNLSIKKTNFIIVLQYNINRVFRKLKIFFKIDLSKFFFNTLFIEEPGLDSGRYMQDFVEKCLNSKNKNIFLLGYFQSSKYFEECKNIIYEELKPPVSKKNNFLEMYKMIKSSNVVALCFRTYFEVPGRDTTKAIDENHMGGIAGIEYYNKSIKIIKEKIKNPVFFVFTPKQYNFLDKLDLGNNFYFINNDTGFSGTIDNLWLMSECKYQIISFSSFYWWGAWFSQYKFGNKSLILRPDGIAGGAERKDYYEDSWVNVNY